MIIHFFIRYTSTPEESLTISFTEGKEAKLMELPLVYTEKVGWSGHINSDEHPMLRKFNYTVLVRNEDMTTSEKILVTGKTDLKKYKKPTVYIIHENTVADNFTKLSRTKPFRGIFRKKNGKVTKQASPNKVTHIFKSEFPVLQPDKFLCLTGSAKKMNGFDPKKPLLFKKNKNNKSALKLNLSKESFPVEYKIAVYDTHKKMIIDYEPGDNRILEQPPETDEVIVIHTDHSFEKYAWKGAGINIPLFSIRTENGWGCGDFTDLHVFADYAAAAGFKLIQLLPVNDTTASKTDKDSYPYAAISSFALHPMYMNVQKLAHHRSVEISDTEQKEISRLASLEQTDYSGVMKLKIGILKKIFEKDKNDFRNDFDWFLFFEINRDWLMPYAAFCTLRDKSGTADYKMWEEYAVYNHEKILQFAEPENEDYENILFWYYVQYHLHLQLKDAADHTRKRGIILKADLPIGVGRYSADTWAHPELFDMQMQAGAPPDAFSVTGQNWSFPTYNINQMAFDNHAWFKKRMEHLACYFDAVRIDHVLGFFRIWSIPLPETDARMGRFVPAIPLTAHDFLNAGLAFKEKKYITPFSADDHTDVILLKDHTPHGGYHFRINMQQTKLFASLPEEEKNILNRLYTTYFYEMQDELWKNNGGKNLKMLKKSTDMLIFGEDLGMVPPFTAEVMHALDILSLQVMQMPRQSDKLFADTATANYESVVTPATHDMAPVRLWWEQNKIAALAYFSENLQQNDPAPYFCEPWICKKIAEQHLQSHAMWSIFLMQDVLAMNGNIRRADPREERINDPANPEQIWNYRMHITTEELLSQTMWNDEVKNMITESGR